MLEPIYIEKTRLTPDVHLDIEKGVFKIEGRSLPEDVMIFYSPILEWIKS